MSFVEGGDSSLRKDTAALNSLSHCARQRVGPQATVTNAIDAVLSICPPPRARRRVCHCAGARDCCNARVTATKAKRAARRARAARWWIYLVRRADGALYAGIAVDVAARLLVHARGRGSKALRGRGPLLLVWRRRVGDRALAQRVEARLKRLGKRDKERIAASPAFARRWLQGARQPAGGSGGRARSRA